MVLGGFGFETFYIVQPIPEYEPRRVKMGRTAQIRERLSQYRGANPNAKVLDYWPSKREWEMNAMFSIAGRNSEQIGPECFLVDDVDQLVQRAWSFFDDAFEWKTYGYVDSEDDGIIAHDYNQWKSARPSPEVLSKNIRNNIDYVTNKFLVQRQMENTILRETCHVK